MEEFQKQALGQTDPPRGYRPPYASFKPLKLKKSLKKEIYKIMIGRIRERDYKLNQ